MMNTLDAPDILSNRRADTPTRYWYVGNWWRRPLPATAASGCAVLGAFLAATFCGVPAPTIPACRAPPAPGIP